MYWGEHFSKGHVTWTSRPAPRLTLSDVQRRGPRTVMRVRLGVAMNYGCTRPGRTLLAVAAFSSSTAAAGGTGRIQIVFDGEGPKARGLVLLPLAPLPREERRAGRGAQGDGERRFWSKVARAGAGGRRPRGQCPSSRGPGRSPPSPQAPFRGGRPVHSTHLLWSSHSVVDQKVVFASRRKQNTPRCVCSQTGTHPHEDQRPVW